MSDETELLKDPVVRRELILDNYEHPHNHQLSTNPEAHSVHMVSDSCIDDIKMTATIKNGVIEDIGFEGNACAISTASTSVMTDLVKGKSVEEAQTILKNYLAMIEEKPYDANFLHEALAFEGVAKQANRIKCATIGWHGLQQLLSDSQKEKHD
jgi:nitrogen fixation NifU-like protein